MKNATLVLCKVTPDLRDEINFIYDGFNPFCFNMFDPPIPKESRKTPVEVPRYPGNQLSMKSSDPTEVSSNSPTGGGGQSVGIKHLGLVAVLFYPILMWALS